MNKLLIILTVLLVLSICKSVIRLLRSYRYIKKFNNYQFYSDNKSKVTIIIPAMNEVNNVSKSVDYFKNMRDLCDVIYVTTDKEVNKSTYKKLKNTIKQVNADNLKVINCPNNYGTMATQINYACKQIKNDCIIGLYNIDSFPERKTFQYVLEHIDHNSVLQQVSYFDDDNKYILNSAQNWQNRWSIIYEMGKYLSNRKLEFKYVIGHGLFFHKRIIDLYGYFDESEINEDNEFGYRLLINNIKIKPIPYMERAGFANSIKIYIKQQSTWVNGPLYAFSYYKKHKKSLRNLLLSILNFKAFLSWWMLPIIWMCLIILSFVYNIHICIALIILQIVYLTVINFFANLTLKKFGYCKKKYYIHIISDFVFFILHTFGSFITIYKIVFRKNTILNKYNTEK